MFRINNSYGGVLAGVPKKAVEVEISVRVPTHDLIPAVWHNDNRLFFLLSPAQSVICSAPRSRPCLMVGKVICSPEYSRDRVDHYNKSEEK